MHHFAVFVWLCLSVAFGNEAGDKLNDECGDSYKMIGECYTKIHICAGFYDWQWKYYGYAEANGTKGPETSHYDSQDGAGYHAVYLLFQTLPTATNTCNCGFVNNYVVANCHMNIEECFRFNTSADVQNQKPDYFAWARPVNVSNVEGYFCCDYSQNVTAENAVKNLQQKDPSCFL